MHKAKDNSTKIKKYSTESKYQTKKIPKESLRNMKLLIKSAIDTSKRTSKIIQNKIKVLFFREIKNQKMV